MIAVVMTGFLYVVYQQGHLAAIRTDAREMRQTRQALVSVDRVVLVSLADVQDDSASVTYGRALSALDGLGSGHIPETVLRGNDPVPSRAVIASLKGAWDDIIAQLEDGQTEAAHETYKLRQVERDMSAILAAFTSTLQGLEGEYAATEARIEMTIWGSILAQIITGLASIFAFLFAARRGAKASRARQHAVSSANATREQVVRLFEMTDMLQSATDHADANSVLSSTAMELLPGMGGALYVFNNSGDRLTLSTHWALPNTEHLPEALGVHQCWALKRGKPHLNSPALKLCCDHHHGSDVCLEVPMIARGEILGLLQIHCEGTEADEKIASVREIASALADSMSLALANLGLRDKLRSQALRDPLTGLYNRRYMEDTLLRMVQLSVRERTDLSVIMIDLDHFKRLNDQYGHAKGDAVLRDTSSLIVGQLRESDVACRYGGEELTIILPHCSLEMAAVKSERIRASIEAMSDPAGPRISASFGVASIPATSSSSKDLMAAADAALYQAKQDGRNRVVCAPPAVVKADRLNEEEDLRAALEAAE